MPTAETKRLRRYIKHAGDTHAPESLLQCLTERLADAMRDRRHPSYTAHALRDLFAQRIYHIASGYADGNDANSLRHDPMFTRSVERLPLDPTQDLASAPTFSRLEHRVTRTDLSRLTQAFVDHCIASYPEPPAAIVLDLDHSEDPTHGQQELTFSNHHYQSHCSLPLCIFAGTSGDNPRFVVTS